MNLWRKDAVPTLSRPPTSTADDTSVFFSSRRRHTRFDCDWSSDVCSSDLRLLRKEKAEVREKSEGVEYWTEKSGDALVTRQANIRWLIKSFEAHGLVLTQRMAGQLSESYTRFSAPPLKHLVHCLNIFWFRYVRWAVLAFGN